MNYYEELGVKPTASAEEIRKAYLELVRLLHPDQHQDEQLRQAAERQLKRLNCIFAVLSDPVERRRYDLRLAASAPLEPIPARGVAGRARAVVLRSWGWWLAAVGVSALSFYFGTQTSRSAPPAPRPQVALSVAPPPTAAETRSEEAEPERVSAPLPAPAARPKGPRTDTLPRWEETPLAMPRVEAEAVAPASSAPADIAASTGAPPQQQEAAPAPTATAASVESPAKELAGLWLWVPSRAAGEPSETFYPPEYIELRLIEEADALYGRYRARYRVPDRTVWPEVAFEFQGRRQQENYAWRGRGGSRGQVRLKRLAGDQLEVTWWASELGEQVGLASGTAVLVREAASAKEIW